MSKKHFVDQGTDEWRAIRIGLPTASNFHKIITPKTGKPSTQAREYMYRLIAERLLNEEMEDNTHTEWIERGKLEQPNAERQLQFTHNLELEPVGFVTTDDGRLGCSPDMLVVGKPEAVEIKCPAPWTQIGRLLDGVGDDYRPQVQGQLLIGEFEFVHFYSWHPRMPPVYVKTVRDERYIRLLQPLLHAFLDELDRQTEKARSLGSYQEFVRHVERLDPLALRV